MHACGAGYSLHFCRSRREAGTTKRHMCATWSFIKRSAPFSGRILNKLHLPHRLPNLGSNPNFISFTPPNDLSPTFRDTHLPGLSNDKAANHPAYSRFFPCPIYANRRNRLTRNEQRWWDWRTNLSGWFLHQCDARRRWAFGNVADWKLETRCAGSSARRPRSYKYHRGNYPSCAFPTGLTAGIPIRARSPIFI